MKLNRFTASICFRYRAFEKLFSIIHLISFSMNLTTVLVFPRFEIDELDNKKLINVG